MKPLASPARSYPSAPRSFFRLARAAALALALLAAPSLHAQRYWDNNGATAGFGTASGTWADPTTNDATQGWSTASAGNATLSGNTTTTTADALNFGTSANQLGTGTVTVSGNVSASTITIVGSSSNITLSGGNITLNAGLTATNSANTTAITQTISSNITLGGSQTWTVNNGGTVGTQNLAVSGNVLGGANGLTKSGNGTLTLSGTANSWNGTTSISTGTLTLSGNLSTTGGIGVTSTTVGVLNVTGNLTQTKAANVRNFVIAGSANSNGTVTVSGSGILNATGMYLGEDGGGNAVLNQSGGTVNNTGEILMGGRTSSLNVSGGVFNMGTQQFTLGAGSLAGGSNSTLTVNGTGSITMGNLRLGFANRNATAMIVNLGDGTAGGNLTITGMSYAAGAGSGPTTINFNGGTLTTNGTFSMATQASTVVKSGGAIFNVLESNTFTISNNLTTDGTGGGLTKNGTGTLTLSGAGNTYNGTTTVNAGTLTLGANQNLGVITGAGALNLSTFTLTTNASSDSAYSGNITGSTGGLTKNGASTLTLSGAANTWNGTTTVSVGTLTLSGNLTAGGSVFVGGASGGVLNVTGNLTQTKAASPRNFQITNGSGQTGTVNVSGSGIINSTGLFFGDNGGGNATLNISGGTFTNSGETWLAGSNNLLAVSGGTLNNPVKLEFGGGIANGVSTITVNGTGTVNVGSIVWGRTTSSNTTLNLGTGSAGGNFSISGISWMGGSNTINFNGGTLTTNGAITISSANAATVVKSGGAVFNVASNTLTISGNLTTDGTGGGLTKNGTGTLTLSGAGNNYTGTTTVNAGTLTLGANQNLGAIAGAGTLNLSSFSLASNATSDTTFSGVISGTGGLTKNGTGTLTLSNAANTYSGTTTINAGTLSVTGSTASSAMAVASGAALTGTGTVGAITLNTGGLIGAGTGTSTVGKLTGSSLSIGSSSGYAFTIGNVNTSVAGTDYDQISLSGALTFSNTAANPFTVYLYGTPTGWSNTGIYSWDLITGATSMDDFAAGSFATDFTNFGIAEGSRNGTWSFSSPTDGTIRLTYSGSAGTSTWNTATGSWNTAAQWSENAIPVNNNSLLFTGSGGTATNNISDSTLTSVNNISFESGAGAYTLAANAGSAGASGGTALAVAGSITNNSTNLQTLNTAISLASTSSVNAASGNITIGGVISGAGGITKSGANSLTLSTANTYSGGTALNAGTLNIGNATAIGTGTLTITSGTLDNTSGGALTLSNNNSQNWNGNFTVAGTNDLNMGTGNVTLGATPTVTVSAGNLTVGGVISGSGRGLTKDGSGLLILSGSNTYTGTTTINAGTLHVRGTNGNIAGAIVNNANLIYGTTVSSGTYGLSNSSITGTGNLTGTANLLRFIGSNITQSGTVSLTGGIAAGLISSGIDFSGNTTITAGSISLTGDIGAQSGQGGNLILNTSATNGAITLDVSLTRNTVWYSLGSLTANAGTGNLTVSGANAGNGKWRGAASGVTLTGALDISSSFTRENGALNLTAAGNSSVTGNLGLNGTTNTWTVNPGLTMTVSGNISGTSAAIAKNGTGTLILSGANNTYTGATTVNAGTLQLSGNISSSALNVNSGGIISVGTNASVAKYNASSITIGAGSGYIFTIGNVNASVAGTDYDQLTATNGLTFNNTAASPFTVYLNGTPTGWSNTGNYTWNIMSGASISGFNSGNFVANTSSFGIASGNRTGTWSFGTSGGNLTLSYTLATPDYFWDGGSGNWTDSYSAGVRGFTPSAPTPDDNLYFTGAGGTVTNNIASGNLSAVNFITFNSTAGAYTLAANAGSAGAGGGTALTVKGDIINNSASNQAISMALAFGGSSSGVINTAAGNITISGNLSGTGTITKTGNSTLTLSGASKTNTGDVTINAGNVTVSGGALSTNITVNSGATLSTSGHYLIAEGGKTLTLNGGTLNASNLYTEPHYIVMSNGTINGNNSGHILSRNGWIGNGNNTINQQVSLENAKAGSGLFDIQSGTTTINSVVYNYVNRTLGITKNGTGALVLNGANTYNGTTTLNVGTLVLNNDTALGISSFTIVSGTLDNTSGSAKTLTNNNTQSWNGDFTFLGTNGSLDMGTGAVTMNASRTVTVSNSTFTVGGAIGGATFGLTKNGSGTLVLSGTSTYNGTTTVNAGTITLGAADRIADTSNLNVAGGTFNLGGFNETLGSITGSGNITLGAGTLTTNSSSNTTFAGLISGAGGLTKNGSSTLTLTGNNTYNGTTTINTGTLLISTTGQLGGGNYSGNISNTGTFRYNSTANQTLGGIISGNGALVKNTASTLTLTGNNTFNGAITITAGTLQISTTGLLGGGSYSANISNDGTLLIASNSNQTLGGVISGSGVLTKNGSGTLTLAGNNNYSGGTTLSTGTLVIGNAAAAGIGTITQSNGSSLLKIDTTGTITNAMSVYNVLASQSAILSGAITVNNATWDIDTGDTLTISGAVSGTGGVTKNGGGTLVLSGNNTYLAPTVVNAGTLNANSTNALGSNNTVQVTGGTLLVSADDAINGKNIALGGSGVGLQFSGNYSGAIGTLTLSANSIIDLGAGSVSIMFTNFDYMDFIANNHTLSIYNWTGTTLWNGGNGTTDTDKVYFGPDLSDEALAKIYFYTGPGDSFLGSGFDLGLKATGFTPALGHQIIPVPEPETWATGILLVLGSGVWLWRKRSSLTTEFTENIEREGRAPAPIEKMVGLFRRNDPNQPQSSPRALSAKNARI